VKPMILGPVLSIRKFLVSFMLFYFSFSKHKNHKDWLLTLFTLVL
jgi:hypothetical protein